MECDVKESSRKCENYAFLALIVRLDVMHLIDRGITFALLLSCSPSVEPA